MNSSAPSSVTSERGVERRLSVAHVDPHGSDLRLAVGIDRSDVCERLRAAELERYLCVVSHASKRNRTAARL
jgi:hypothetical protein